MLQSRWKKESRIKRKEIPSSYEIENFPMVLQLPELPTGCEVTALTMALNYQGLPAEKAEMAADQYLQQAGSSLKAYDMTGSSPEDLYRMVAENRPVVVLVTVAMGDRWDTQGWYTETGEYVDWSQNDHGAVLVGYTETTVKVADPLAGLMKYDRVQFEKVYASRGSKSLIIK